MDTICTNNSATVNSITFCVHINTHFTMHIYMQLYTLQTVYAVLTYTRISTTLHKLNIYIILCVCHPTTLYYIIDYIQIIYPYTCYLGV